MPILQLHPRCVWENFYSLTQIPRPSKREGKAIDFVEQFGKNLGLETVRDEVGNVIIRKPATPGMENRKGIILQAHVDMVPQKNNDTVHDFDKDPIKTRIVEGWVHATGTTLGADNGLGCAAIMSFLESTDLEHGPLEALFTMEEETGMTGARALKPNMLNGEILINLDSEDEGELYVGCAGGLDLSATFEGKTEAVPATYEVFAINVKGLRGGHSGMEINEGRANSNKIIVRMMLPVLQMGGKLLSIDGGNLRNAIPREAVAVMAVPAEKMDDVKAVVAKVFADCKNEYAPIDPDLNIYIEPAQGAEALEDSLALNATKAVYACLSGVDRMSLAMADLVETSNNLAIFKSTEGKVEVKCLLRGSTDSAKETLGVALSSIFELAGATVTLTGGYSGWQPNMNSPILKAMKESYKELYLVEPAVKAIHAGLECGILGTNYPHWDMISCGPTIRSPHSPDEKVNIVTVTRWWDFLVYALKNAPIK